MQVWRSVTSSTLFFNTLNLLALTPVLAQMVHITSPAATDSNPLQRVIHPDWPGADSRTKVLVGQAPADLGAALPMGSRGIGAVHTAFQPGESP